jgi:hypothetical protein
MEHARTTRAQRIAARALGRKRITAIEPECFDTLKQVMPTATSQSFDTLIGTLFTKIGIDYDDLNPTEVRDYKNMRNLTYDFIYERNRFSFYMDYLGNMSSVFINGHDTGEKISPIMLYRTRYQAIKRDGMYINELLYIAKDMLGSSFVEINDTNDLLTKPFPEGRNFFVSPVFVPKDTIVGGKPLEDSHYITLFTVQAEEGRKFYVFDSEGCKDMDYSDFLGLDGHDLKTLAETRIQRKGTGSCGLFVINTLTEANKHSRFEDFSRNFDEAFKRELNSRVVSDEWTERYLSEKEQSYISAAQGVAH